MKAEELMLNDIITFKDSLDEDECPLKVKISSLYCDGDAAVNIDDNPGDDLITIDDECVGIPINGDILNKNGFKKHPTENKFYRGNEFYDMTIVEFTDSIWMVKYRCLEAAFPCTQSTFGFVHELQHILRLCGLDDLADNFEI